jgi:DNA-cytosine methyltransferase|tara:strand:+ start:194 stop:1975 length:1782 start_codon:yes stop_codon:yes gene_type:complete
MKVLSLFDGMSCGQIALKQLGIKVDTYYSSEIDKYAMQITQKNFPNTIQVGDICNLDPKDFMDVDLIQAGSPCQGFSFAGKQLAFDDPRSALFFEFIRLLKAIKPKYFLLENVRMKKEFLEVITEQVSSCYTADDVAPEFKDMFGNVKFEPHFINASLVSAQSRQRYYWTNIPGVKQPEDRGIVLRDILETEPESITKMSEKFVKRNGDKNCMIDQNKEKASNLSAMEYVKNGRQGDYLACDQSGKPTNKPIKVGMNVEEVKVRKHEVNISGLQHLLREMKKESKKTNKQIAKETDLPVTKVEHWFRTDKSFAIPSEDIWLKLKEVLGIKTEVFDASIMEFEYKDGVFESTQRVYSDQGKSPTLTASNKEQMIETKPKQVGVAVDVNGYDCLKRVYSPDGKSPTVTTCQGGNTEPKVVTGAAFRGRAYDKDGKRMDKDGKSVANQTKQMLELRKDNKSNAITTVGKDSVVVKKLPDKSKVLKANYYKSSKANFENDTSKGGKFSATGVPLESKVREKSKTVRSGGRGSYDRHEWDSVDELHWRKLTPLECERLQTVPDNYTEGVSNTQRYRMLGNGWCVAVIEHIYQNMEHDE